MDSPMNQPEKLETERLASGSLDPEMSDIIKNVVRSIADLYSDIVDEKIEAVKIEAAKIDAEKVEAEKVEAECSDNDRDEVDDLQEPQQCDSGPEDWDAEIDRDESKDLIITLTLNADTEGWTADCKAKYWDNRIKLVKNALEEIFNNPATDIGASAIGDSQEPRDTDDWVAETKTVQDRGIPSIPRRYVPCVLRDFSNLCVPEVVEEESMNEVVEEEVAQVDVVEEVDQTLRDFFGDDNVVEKQDLEELEDIKEYDTLDTENEYSDEDTDWEYFSVIKPEFEQNVDDRDMDPLHATPPQGFYDN